MRLLVLALLFQWGTAFAHCLRVAPDGAGFAVDICTPDGIHRVVLPADDPGGDERQSAQGLPCPACQGPAAFALAAPAVAIAAPIRRRRRAPRCRPRRRAPASQGRRRRPPDPLVAPESGIPIMSLQRGAALALGLLRAGPSAAHVAPDVQRAAAHAVIHAARRPRLNPADLNALA
jgi:hypothetical protein